jgi:hypothetical protein
LRTSGRILQIAGLTVGLAALALQFALTIPASMTAGRGLFGSLVFYFSFFTILTNIAAVLVHVSLLSPAGYAWLPAFAGARVRAGVAVAITVVMLVYATVLAGLWQPQGLFLLCDVLLHYVTPILFVGWWLVAGADGTTRWKDIPGWLAYPLAYVLCTLARKPLAGEVPYPFLDAATYGVAGVALAVTGLIALFLVLSALQSLRIMAFHALGRPRSAADRKDR